MSFAGSETLPCPMCEGTGESDVREYMNGEPVQCDHCGGSGDLIVLDPRIFEQARKVADQS